MFVTTADSFLLCGWSVLSCFLKKCDSLNGSISASSTLLASTDSRGAAVLLCALLRQYFKVHFHQSANKITLLTQNKYQSDFSETLAAKAINL